MIIGKIGIDRCLSILLTSTTMRRIAITLTSVFLRLTSGLPLIQRLARRLAILLRLTSLARLTTIRGIGPMTLTIRVILRLASLPLRLTIRKRGILARHLWLTLLLRRLLFSTIRGSRRGRVLSLILLTLQLPILHLIVATLPGAILASVRLLLVHHLNFTVLCGVYWCCWFRA